MLLFIINSDCFPKFYICSSAASIEEDGTISGIVDFYTEANKGYFEFGFRYCISSYMQ